MLSHFVFVNRFLFYRRTVVVRSGYGRRDHFCAPSGRCCWTYSEPEVMTGELYNLVVIQV